VLSLLQALRETRVDHLPLSISSIAIPNMAQHQVVGMHSRICSPRKMILRRLCHLLILDPYYLCDHDWSSGHSFDRKLGSINVASRAAVSVNCDCGHYAAIHGA
jgi:hypothetical protein